MPDFDRLDGGIRAQALFVLQGFGPMTLEDDQRIGSGFISRNNDEPTAAATFQFMRQAGIPRRLTATWNLIPGWNGTIATTAAERCEGLAHLRDLLQLLPDLRAVVLVGRVAGAARPALEGRYAVFSSAHPSRRVWARWKAHWEAIPNEWAKVRPYISL